MAELGIRLDRIKHNIQTLDGFFLDRQLTWTLVLKVLGGQDGLWGPLLDSLETKALRGVADSRLDHLEAIKAVRPQWETWQIRPPVIANADRIIRAVDVSCNSSFRTLRALNRAAGEAGLTHRVILMVELGENREGFPVEELRANWDQVRALDHLEILGLGANLGCLYGVEPSHERLTVLEDLRNDLAQTSGAELPLLSGGSSINLPLVEKDQSPEGINHYRIGEAAFFGTSPYDNQPFGALLTDNFDFTATVLEVHDKKPAPEGDLVPSAIGTTLAVPEETPQGVQALLDFGLVDADPADLTLRDPGLTLVGSTSDMTLVYDPSGKLRTGEQVRFKPSYMGVAKLSSSGTVGKVLL